MSWSTPLRKDTNSELAVVFVRLAAKHGAGPAVREIKRWVETSERMAAEGYLERWLDVLREHSVPADDQRSFLWKDKS